MAELGAGGGSDYPGALDTDVTPEIDLVHDARADVPNDLADAILKIEQHLGIAGAGGEIKLIHDLDADGNSINNLLSLGFKDDQWAQQFNNLLKNGSFESWSLGAALAPDGWLTVGAGHAIAREANTVRFGEYSAKLTRGGADCHLYQYFIPAAGIDANTNTYWRGRTVTLGCWVWAQVADRARISIGDGVGASSLSAFHPGDSVWHFIAVTHTLDAAATELVCNLSIYDGDTDAYFDGAILVEGTIAPTFAPNPVDWGANLPVIITAAPVDVGLNGEIRFYSAGGVRRIYMSDGANWKHQVIAT